MKKIGLLALALVLALGSLGVGYAMWYEDLFIEGTVYTGELDVEWSLDDYGDSEVPEKNVSWVEAEIIGNYLYVDVYNAYPCIDYWVKFDVDNFGTIPVHLCPLVCTGVGAAFPGTITITNPDPFQIHPQERALGTISIHLDNTAVEGSQYSFSCLLKAVQYNEKCPGN